MKLAMPRKGGLAAWLAAAVRCLGNASHIPQKSPTQNITNRYIYIYMGLCENKVPGCGKLYVRYGSQAWFGGMVWGMVRGYGSAGFAKLSAC